MTRQRRAGAYALILAPAGAGAALDAPWPLTLAVVGLTVFLATRAGVLVTARERRSAFTKNLVLACSTIALGIVAAQLVSPRYFGLVVAGWSMVCDVVWRVWPEEVGVQPAERASTRDKPV
jgi:hypothetical protein